MAVVEPQLPADPWNSHDAPWEDENPYVALRERARELRREARKTVAHSRALRLLLEEWQDGRSTQPLPLVQPLPSQRPVDLRRNGAVGDGLRTTDTLCVMRRSVATRLRARLSYL
jgi:hypothetical protein